MNIIRLTLDTIPYFATLNGFIRSVSKEYPKINFTCIDIDLLSNTHETAEHNIFNYISNYKYQSGETIALRRGKAYTLKPKKVILPKSYVTTFENEGVCVIIGGSGGIGTALSKDKVIMRQEVHSKMPISSQLLVKCHLMLKLLTGAIGVK